MLFAAVDIGSSIQQGLDAFFAFIPKLVGFLIVLLIGYIIARVVKGIALADYASTYLALGYAIDPTPVSAITELKARISQ